MNARKPAATASQPAWPGCTHVSTFIRCLHLLDVDLLEDWPSITEETLTAKSAAQNLQHRFRAVEWSLYRLFELYNADEAKDKLRPFFPPSTPLQSVNLRAALYRCLLDLKKNGLLGKEVQLRKTMLDECKGPRFEEVIAAFAILVLRKVTTKQTVAGAGFGAHDSEHRLLPLVLAHRVSLQGKLESRREVKRNFRSTLEQLQTTEDTIQSRKAEVSAASLVVEPGEVVRVESMVNTNWIGDRGWARIVLNGKPPAAGEDVLHEVAHDRQRHFLTDIERDDKALLERLDAMIGTHQSRLAEWKVIAKDLTAQNTKLSQTRTPVLTANPKSAAIRFHAHKNPTLQAEIEEKSEPLVHNVHQDLLNRMSEEMQMIDQVAKSSPRTLRSTDLSSEASFTRKHHPALTFADTKEKIPQDKTSPGDRNVVVDQPTTLEVVSTMEALSEVGTVLHSSSSVSSLAHEDELSSTWIPDSVSSATIATTTTILPPQTLINGDDNGDGYFRAVSPEKEPAETPTSPSRAWMSLVDRTRATMVSTTKNDAHHKQDKVAEERLPSPALTHDAATSSATPAEVKYTNLVERTRQSMSLLSQKPFSRERSMRQSTRMSQLFPTNQFETPGKPRSSRQSDFGPDSGSSTPREKLFEEEADYNSVFKSRPKLAMSPALSPERSFMDVDDSMLQQKMDDLGLESDVEDESHLP